MVLINQLTSAFMQVAVLTFIPFACYVITRRTVRGFWAWLGLMRAQTVPVKEMAAIFVGFIAAIALPYLWLYRAGALSYSGFTVDAYRAYGWGVPTIATVLVWATVQTSLSEEIFFRGFLGKWLGDKLGWQAGTAVQAGIFGLIHVASVWGHGIVAVALIFLMTGGIGFLLGWLCLRRAEGSILYGWPVHAAANIVSPLVVFAFLL